ncbi:MAG TPA: hypothetical protein PL039_10480, partial [Kiritimatiellia bacterium]|nr:hypothetical protein [Kiritimatiellia bacterium]
DPVVAELAHGVREVLLEYLAASGHEFVRHECGLSPQRLKAVIRRRSNLGDSDILPGASSPHSKESASLSSVARAAPAWPAPMEFAAVGYL